MSEEGSFPVNRTFEPGMTVLIEHPTSRGISRYVGVIQHLAPHGESIVIWRDSSDLLPAAALAVKTEWVIAEVPSIDPDLD